MHIRGIVGYPNKGLDVVAYCVEPLGCVRFVTAPVRWKTLLFCFMMALLKNTRMQWGSGALCWPTITHSSSLPALAFAEGQVSQRARSSGVRPWGSGRLLSYYKLLGSSLSGEYSQGSLASPSSYAPLLFLFV